jgi:hypothetical protein
MSFIASLRVRVEQESITTFVVLIDNKAVFSGTKEECDEKAFNESRRIEGL